MQLYVEFLLFSFYLKFKYAQVDDFNQAGLIQSLSEAKLALPSIVKPQVACGVADSHSMVILSLFLKYKDTSHIAANTSLFPFISDCIYYHL